MAASTSAEPDLEVDARLPCLAMSSSEEAMIDEAVLMLNVEWPSPPVPTMSHCHCNSQYEHDALSTGECLPYQSAIVLAKLDALLLDRRL